MAFKDPLVSFSVSLPAGITVFQRDWLSANNVFLHNAEQTVLIDSGYSTHADMTLSLLDQALCGRNLDLLINTHLHSDHCGGNSTIQLAHPGVKTLIPPGQFLDVSQWNSDALTFDMTGQQCPPFLVNGHLLDKQTCTWAGTNWQVYAAPGHDTHAMMFFCPEHRILISGDALWEKGFGVIFPELDGVEAYSAAADTLDLIEQLSPSVVIPGHGNLFTDLDSALSFARSRLASFRTHPDKHARYASKVLVKFKLQEYGSIELSPFVEWAQTVPYLMGLHLQLGPDYSFREWFEQLLGELCQSGAMDMQGELLINRP